MSDHYDHKGVTITPQPGGYYELTHPSLAEPIRERGKEKAEQRADEIALATTNVDDDSHIAPQGEIPEIPTPPDALPADPTAAIASMAAQMAAMQARMDEMAAAGIRTVGHTDGDAAPRAPIPLRYTGEMSEATRDALHARGFKTVKIVLEESEHIPPTGLFVGHNGKSYMIQPGVPVELPDFLVGVLNDAVTSSPIVNTESKKVIGYRDRLKYPYRQVE